MLYNLELAMIYVLQHFTYIQLKFASREGPATGVRAELPCIKKLLSQAVHSNIIRLY